MRMANLKFRKGFGLLEVLLAAVVLGFLIVGLNNLQKGNRESILRVRARDAANFVAQHVLDSLGSVGSNSLTNTVGGTVHEGKYDYYFEGKPQLDKKTGGIKVETEYDVVVKLLEIVGMSQEDTYFTGGTPNNYSKSLEATVSWKYKGSTQSITMAKVVR